jgi:hypothetical protein
MSLVASLYLFVLAVGPLLHHDLSCELKSRTHCVICVSGVSGPGLPQAAAPPIFDLPPAGPLPVTRAIQLADRGACPVPGRSPPAA